MTFKTYQVYLESVLRFARVTIKTFEYVSAREYRSVRTESDGGGKQKSTLQDAIQEASSILATCGLDLAKIDIRLNAVDPKYGFPILKYTVSTLKDLVEIAYRIQVQKTSDNSDIVYNQAIINHMNHMNNTIRTYVDGYKRNPDAYTINTCTFPVRDTTIMEIEPIFAKIVKSILVTVVDGKCNKMTDVKYLFQPEFLTAHRHFPATTEFKKYVSEYELCDEQWYATWQVKDKEAFALLYPQDVRHLNRDDWRHPEYDVSNSFEYYVKKMDDIDIAFMKFFSPLISTKVIKTSMTIINNIGGRFHPEDINFIFHTIEKHIVTLIMESDEFEKSYANMNERMIKYFRPFIPVSKKSMAKHAAKIIIRNLRMIMMGTFGEHYSLKRPVINQLHHLSDIAEWRQSFTWVADIPYFEFYTDQKENRLLMHMLYDDPEHVDDDMYIGCAIRAAAIALQQSYATVSNGVTGAPNIDHDVVYSHAQNMCLSLGGKHAAIISSYIALCHCYFSEDDIMDYGITKIVKNICDLIYTAHRIPWAEHVFQCSPKSVPSIIQPSIQYKEVKILPNHIVMNERSLLVNGAIPEKVEFTKEYPQSRNGSWSYHWITDKCEASLEREHLVIYEKGEIPPYKDRITLGDIVNEDIRRERKTSIPSYKRNQNPLEPFNEDSMPSVDHSYSEFLSNFGALDGNGMDQCVRSQIRSEFDRAFSYNHSGTEEYYQQVDEINDILRSCGFKCKPRRD